MRNRFFLPLLLLFTGALNSNAQILDFMNKVTIPLKDGTTVVLFGAARSLDTLFSGEYYYLPANLRLSKKKDGVPEFLFLKYTTNESAGGVNGALMHFLMQWGLTPEQEKEVQEKLSARVKGLAASNPRYRLAREPRLMGAANVKTDEENSFQIISALLSDRKSTPTLVTSGRAPVMPGGKVAVGALLEKTPRNSWPPLLKKAVPSPTFPFRCVSATTCSCRPFRAKLPSTGNGSTRFTSTTPARLPTATAATKAKRTTM